MSFLFQEIWEEQLEGMVLLDLPWCSHASEGEQSGQRTRQSRDQLSPANEARGQLPSSLPEVPDIYDGQATGATVAGAC